MICPTFMIVPSMACQGSCKYCFGPHKGAVMTKETAVETVSFILQIAKECQTRNISIIFHGGEPLLAPMDVWKTLLEQIEEKLKDYSVNLNLQSNLWNLSDEFIKLFKKYHVSIGTSIDGPKTLCDMNRGEGYFDKTYSSAKRAQIAGKNVSAIATVTKQTLPYVKEILEFFAKEDFSPVLHAAVDSLDGTASQYALSAQQYADMIIGLFPWYVERRYELENETLDRFVKSFVIDDPCVCTFKDCFGMFLAISPVGDITSCQRLSGRKEYVLGNIFDHPTFKELSQSPSALKQLERQQRVKEKCGKCDFYEICKGGCYYNAISNGDDIDPLCDAYRQIYTFVRNVLTSEALEEENVNEIKRRPIENGKHPLLRKGAYISLGYDPHPTHIADNARMLLSAYALGKYNDIKTAAKALYDEKFCNDVNIAERQLELIKNNMLVNRRKLNNCYIHVTFNCNLRCSHCYAEGGENDEEMPIPLIERLIEEAIELKYDKVVITGGEPLVHGNRDELLNICTSHRNKKTRLTLRTNLCGNFTDEELLRIALAFDQVIVSIDGDEKMHDLRRGTGSYANTVSNCVRYVDLCRNKTNAAELSFGCVMKADDINGDAGDDVRMLARKLSVRNIRFRPLLPIGRAANMKEPVICEGLMEHELPEDRLKNGFHPIATCGIGQNIYIRPNGECYPCYAWCQKHVCLGNLTTMSIDEVMKSEKYAMLFECNVDTIEKCRNCEYRYICGGACRAWGNSNATDINASPPDCKHLQQRAKDYILAAKKILSRKQNDGCTD